MLRGVDSSQARRPAGFWFVVPALFAIAACGSSSREPDRDAGTDAAADVPDAADATDVTEVGDAGDERPFATTLTTATEFAGFAEGPQGDVKYIAAMTGRPGLPPLTESCYFVNSRRHTWHLQFLLSFPEFAGLTYDGYLALLVHTATRQMWSGAVKFWPIVRHPVSGQPGIYVYDIHGDPGGVDAAAIREVDQRMKTCLPFARERLVFVPKPVQVPVVTEARAAFFAEGIATLFPEDLVEGVNHLAHSPGEGYGTLRVIPAGQPLDDYGPRDVVIVQSAPNDISIVAGLITQNPQNDLGHVNLRLREKAIPNVTVPAIYQSAEIAALDGQLVHLVVSDTSFSLTATTLAKAQAFWDAHRPRVRPPVADLTVEALADFATLRATGAPAYGAKAANLGELTRVLAAPNRNDGFAIPFARYAAFAQATGIAAEVTAVLADPRLLTDRAFKRAQLAQLRARIRNAPFPPALLADIRAAATVAFGSADRGYLRFRSSTNVEDLDAFTGAGLYESRTGCLGDDAQPPQTPGPSACLTPAIEADLRARLATRRAELAAHPDRTWLGPIIADLEEDLTERKPVAGAVKKVWASLWEERAFDERAYYGIDHELAFMGIAVNPSFKVERASAVAVSNLTVDNGPPLYRLNSQIGSESVVRPEDPTAVAELLTFRRAGTPPEATDVRVQVRSNRVPATELVWPAPKLAELARLLFQVHDHFAAVVYPHIAPLALDFEIKHDADGNVVIKQVRPLVGQGTRP